MVFFRGKFFGDFWRLMKGYREVVTVDRFYQIDFIELKSGKGVLNR
jgi:hypothetical protein